MLDAIAHLPDGGQVLVTGEAQDIVRRVREGDPTKGWEGDSSMRVTVSPYEGQFSGEVRWLFEVWAVDNHGEPYLCVQSETCGPELIEKLVRADTRRRDVIAEAMAAQDKAQADRKAAMAERHEDIADRLAFALQGDNAAHFGGKGRLHPVKVLPRPNRAERRRKGAA